MYLWLIGGFCKNLSAGLDGNSKPESNCLNVS